ncbi:unnamed protein product [Rotaria socialis]
MMTPSTNEINTQSVSTSVLVNQQPQSYYVYEDTRTQGLLCIPSFMMIFILPAWLLYLAICSFTAPPNEYYQDGYFLLTMCFAAIIFIFWVMCTSIPCIRIRIRITDRLTTILSILWSGCLVQYNQFIEKTSEFSKKLWHKRELNYRLPIDFSKQAAIV